MHFQQDMPYQLPRCRRMVYETAIMPAKTAQNTCDIIIIGAGPAGLCLARALAPSGLKITLIEKAPLKSIVNPAADGRDIALTHLSRHLMTELGMWQTIDKKEINPLHEARVVNGTSPYFLRFHQPSAPDESLGFLIANHVIRKAAYDSLKGFKNIRFLADTSVKSVKTSTKKGEVTLSTGKKLSARLIIAADSRFSATRAQMGIEIERKEFGRTVIVGRVKHSKPHGGIAYECFIDEQTLAVLPLHGKTSSFVITLPDAVAEEVMQMPDREFGEFLTGRFQGRVGKMDILGMRYPYPLVGVFSKTFHAPRYALVGDAAVGMHPVTAHGFNFGLRGGYDLAGRIIAALEKGEDIGSEKLLGAYTRKHRRITRPLYLSTNALVALYTSKTPVAQMARKGLLHLGNALRPINKLLMNRLTELPAAKRA